MDDEPRQTEDAAAKSSGSTSGSTVSGKRVDWEAALDVTAGDLDLLFEVLEAFQIETPRMVMSIGEALAAGDAKLLHRAAHTAKNAFYSIGAQATGDIAFKLEMVGKEAAFDQVPPLLAQLESHMQQVAREVVQFMREKGRV